MTDTIKIIKQVIVNDIQDDVKNNELFERIKKACSKFEGKNITKRLETTVKNELGEGYIVYLDHSHGLINLRVYPVGQYDNRTNFFMGYDHNPIYREGKANEQHSGFEYYSVCYGEAAKKRIEEATQFLNDSNAIEQFANTIDRYIQARDDLNRYNSSDIPSYYSIMKAVGIKE